MTIKRFEELEIWQQARELAKKIRVAADNSTLGKDFSLRDQIFRSSGSVMDNIAEGFERDGKKEFMMFLYYAKGSAGETRSQIYRAFDAGHLKEDLFNELLNDCLNLSAKIAHFISYLAKSDYQGKKKRTN